ncbi:MAG TPA: Sec-independent protein translocase protein TatB [Steroidobacteraceae bacterium]|nr:Sec-independent protein translocase protein TatB [Steroidobacteraceae bacterium]
MFEVGFTEIILILGIALLVLGPEKLPKLANQIGRWVGRARSMTRQLRQQLDEEVTIVSKEDFDPAARRPPGTPPPEPPAADAGSSATADKPGGPPPPA